MVLYMSLPGFIAVHELEIGSSAVAFIAYSGMDTPRTGSPATTNWVLERVKKTKSVTDVSWILLKSTLDLAVRTVQRASNPAVLSIERACRPPAPRVISLPCWDLSVIQQ